MKLVLYGLQLAQEIVLVPLALDFLFGFPRFRYVIFEGRLVSNQNIRPRHSLIRERDIEVPDLVLHTYTETLFSVQEGGLTPTEDGVYSRNLPFSSLELEGLANLPQ